MRLRILSAVTLLLGVLVSTARPAPPVPRLAVIIVVDQMRADYVDRFAPEWTGGLKRLVARGAWFRNAMYPYLTTVTCAGHATVATGAFPHTTGVFQNAWWDREAGRAMTCTADPRATDIGYDAPKPGGDSAWRLQVPTFADAMRAGRQAHVATLSLKDRSAIMLAGHGGDAVTWWNDLLDDWLTSSAYAKAPVAAVAKYVRAHPVAADYGRTWTPMLPPTRYSDPDTGVGEAPPPGWTATFPHALTGTHGKPDATFRAQWERSPYADAYLGRLAAALAGSLRLGRHAGTDVLGVSFSSPDLVGHAFGPRSREIEDMYARLDRTLGLLFDSLDRLVGPERWVVALTADHGVTPIPEQLEAEGRDAGRLSPNAIATAIESRLQPALGQGTHVALVDGNDIYFQPGVYDRIRSSPELAASVVAAVAAVPGVQRVFRSEALAGEAASADPLTRAAALSYVPGQSGDLIIAPKPGWMFSGSGTTHGTADFDDQHVPILLMGPGIRHGQYQDAATPADVAPTLAALCGIALPHAEGHPLRAALR